MKPAESYSGREQTYLKHFFLEKYLERVAYKVGSFAKEFVYVDGFSGPWQTSDPGFEDSSFMIAIKKLREVRDGLRAINRTPKIRCIFVEPDPAAYPLLVNATSAVTDIDIKTINSEFETAIPEVLQIIGSAFSLVFIDPTGWTGFGLNQISPILRHQPGEVLVNFMFDHINRFLDTPSPEMSFDDLFGGPGWKDVVKQSPDREDAIIAFYTERLKANGGFDYATSTRVKKPLADRSYFYLVYGTRHDQGIVEFRSVEKKEISEQERVRLNAQELDRFLKTGQTNLFSSPGFERPDIGVASFETERQENLNKAKQRLLELLNQKVDVSFGDARVHLLELPLVWEPDVKRLVAEHAEILGLTGKQRVPKAENRIRLKRHV